jgi:ParB-like chromosome segregation protein Spo0J
MRVHDMNVEMVSVDAISQHPENANNGDVEAISESIEVNGFFAPMLVQRSTGYIMVGNHRYQAALELDMHEVPVIFLNVSDAEAKRIMVADNRTSRLGFDDEAQLGLLLDDLYATDIGLAGTGFDYQDLEKIHLIMDEPLEFPEEPVMEPAEPKDKAKPSILLSVLPQIADDGHVYELTVMKEGWGPITASEFNLIRRMLGLETADKAELRAYVVPQWRV